LRLRLQLRASVAVAVARFARLLLLSREGVSAG
jgi:hypothetical protein